MSPGSTRSISEPKAVGVRFPSVERFVTSYVAGSPLAGPVAAAPAEARGALLAEVVAKLRQFVHEELEFPIEAHLARARRLAAPEQA